MPCPIAGDFKFRQNRLDLNVFFRTHDVYRLGYPDFFFMRALQREILARVHSEARHRFTGAKNGELNLFFSRAFILRSHFHAAARLLDTLSDFERDWIEDT
jgi:thymidylate synthase